MNKGKKLSRKWGISFVVIGLAAFATCIAGLIYKEYTVAIATGIVFIAQLANFIQWFKQR